MNQTASPMLFNGKDYSMPSKEEEFDYSNFDMSEVNSEQQRF